MKKIIKSTATVVALSAFIGQAQAADGGARHYTVSITNITKNILFTPMLATTHHNTAPLFHVGEPASEAVVKIAEGGDTSMLTQALEASDRVHTVSNAAAPLHPGETVELQVQSNKYHDRVSVMGMLLPTNDALVALRSAKLPNKGKQTYYAHAYDAGSEMNDELCVSIPGPQCGGAPFSPEDHGEGYIYPHPGIHGEGDLSIKQYQWQGPVAKVVVRRMQ